MEGSRTIGVDGITGKAGSLRDVGRGDGRFALAGGLSRMLLLLLLLLLLCSEKRSFDHSA